MDQLIENNEMKLCGFDNEKQRETRVYWDNGDTALENRILAALQAQKNAGLEAKNAGLELKNAGLGG